MFSTISNMNSLSTPINFNENNKAMEFNIASINEKISQSIENKTQIYNLLNKKKLLNESEISQEIKNNNLNKDINLISNKDNQIKDDLTTTDKKI